MTKILLASLLGIIMIFMFAIWAQQSGENSHGDIKWDCQSCHTTESWSKLKEQMEFEHAETGFPLLGEHKFTDCASCHTSKKFAEVGTACADCHTDIHRGQFGVECHSCHTPESWENRQDVFEQHANIGFPLVGVHAIADCQACHVSEQQIEFRGAPRECNNCHVEDFSNTINPNHSQAGFSMKCSECHQPTSLTWKEAEFRHPPIFELRGAHTQTDCNSCHTQIFAGTSQECFNCHSAEFQSAQSPPHAEGGFPTECSSCHNEVRWEDAQFDHLQMSGFALNGAHATIQCADCHVDNQFAGTARECIGCHESDFNTVVEPNHVQSNFPTDCVVCHTENAWEPAEFDHSLTDFPLTNAHFGLECTDCHTNNQFTTLPVECFSCHEADFNTVTDPNHVQNNFSQDCMDCHNTVTWSPATFDHAQTQFPLTGAHVPLECNECHSQGFSGTPVECFSCHENDFNSVADPDHVQNNFSQDCIQCHSTEAWSPSTFDHAQTQFPLTGAHITLECSDCHSQGFAGTPVACFSCHEDDFNSVTDPNHVQNNFSHDCLQCHTTNDWDEVIFDHSQTQFPLTGAHILLECITCHASGYTGTPTDCFSCHEDDFNSVSDPNHVQNNFSHDCLECHDTNAWSPATFDHSQTQFPLTGAHLTLECLDCHSDGYAGTPIDCYSCHQDDYNNTTDPNHLAAGFSTTCETCHNTSNWNQTTWDHDNMYFPIYSGRHQGEWTTCADCHVDPNNYTVFECIFCHEHNQQDMDEEHRGVSGYVYLSSACYNCHPNGEESIRLPRMK